MSAKTLNLSSEVYAYYQKHALRESEVLQKLRLQTAKMSMGQMQIAPEQGQFMRLLIELMQAKKTLEIGVFTGYSTLCVALGLPENGKIIACDINVEWTKLAKRFWEMAGVMHKIDLRLAPALDTLQALLDQGDAETFDFVFIDADKQNYLDYYEKSLNLVRVGGLIAIDNVLWGGDVADPAMNDKNTAMIRRVNDVLLQDERVTLSMVPIGDGLTLARKR
ncbi:MAG: class I SAM-dependent methyltransferase [Gammaproteobacteria bacterium]